MMIKIAVKILPRKEVLDVEGRAIAEMLKTKGHAIEDCRYGKFLILTILEKNQKSALKTAEEIAKNILCNALVENYELEILSPST